MRVPRLELGRAIWKTAMQPVTSYTRIFWKRDSNSQPIPYQGSAPPLSYSRVTNFKSNMLPNKNAAARHSIILGYVNCAECQVYTANPKFCSKRCSVTSHNRTTPKRKLKTTCARCGAFIRSHRKFCNSCWSKRGINYSLDCTLREVQARYKKYGTCNMNTLVRSRARAALIAEGRTACQVCGYEKFFEAAHIKPVSMFHPDTLIRVVNASDNLLALCPNHHWELDHLGKIELSTPELTRTVIAQI